MMSIASRQMTADVALAAETASDGSAPASAQGSEILGKRDVARKRRERPVDLAIRHEENLDYAATAALADEGFGFAPGTFDAATLRWLYEEAFSDGTSVLGAYAGDRKVGHIALVHHSVTVDGRNETAVALIDLFILPAFRSRAAISGLYGAVEAVCVERGIRFIVAMPNEKAAPVNRRHLKLGDVGLLDIRVGLAWVSRPWRKVSSYRVRDVDAATALPVLSRYCGDKVSGLHWTGERLWARLRKPRADYAFHAGERVLAVSASRTMRGTRYTLICALLPRPGAKVRRQEVGAVVAAACRTHRNPLFVYLGRTTVAPKPGLPLPKRLRPSQMILQLRDFSPGATPVAFDRFEPLDFDFC